MTVKDLVTAERERLKKYGLNEESFVHFRLGELTDLAICYALSEVDRGLKE
jgi:hypothetical protein